MYHNIKIDWLTFTGKTWVKEQGEHVLTMMSSLKVAQQVISGLLGGIRTFEIDRPDPFYKYAWRDKITGLVINIPVDISQQGWKIAMSGDTLSALPQARDILEMVVLYGYNITRLDVAVDLFDSGVQPGIVSDEQRAAAVGQGDRSVGLIDSPNGATCYIGTRTSMRYMRVYDKAAQQKVPMDWIRCELEYKKTAATIMAGEYLKDPHAIVADMCEMLTDKASSLHEVLTGIAGGVSRPSLYIPKSPPKRGVWLREQVSKAVLNHVREHPDDVVEWLSELIVNVMDAVEHMSDESWPPLNDDMPF